MRNKVKKNQYRKSCVLFFDGMINTKNLDPNKFKMDEKLFKSTFYLPHWICHGQRP